MKGNALSFRVDARNKKADGIHSKYPEVKSAV